MSHLFAKIKSNCHLLVFCCHVVSHYSFGRQLMHSLVNYFLIPVFCLSPECCCFPQVLTFVWIIACFKTVTPLHVQTKMEHPLLLLEYSKVLAGSRNCLVPIGQNCLVFRWFVCFLVYLRCMSNKFHLNDTMNSSLFTFCLC